MATYLSYIDEAMLRSILDPADAEQNGALGPFDGDWWRRRDIVQAVVHRLRRDHPDAGRFIWGAIEGRVDRIMKTLRSEPYIETERYGATGYLYRYASDELILQRAREREEREAQKEAARKEAERLEAEAYRLGIRLEVKGAAYDEIVVTPADMARLLASFKQKPVPSDEGAEKKLWLCAVGKERAAVIQTVAYVTGLRLLDAKRLVECCSTEPVVVLCTTDSARFEQMRASLEAAGASLRVENAADHERG